MPTITRRRALLLGGLGMGAAAVAGTGLGAGLAGTGRGDGGAAPGPVLPTPASPAPTPAAQIVAATGTHQAGIERPAVPQRHDLFLVAWLDLLDSAAPEGALRDALAAAGREIQALASGEVDAVTPDGPAELTVTLGLGPRALAATAHPGLAEAVTLPLFRGDSELDPDRLGGDLLISASAQDPGILAAVVQRVAAPFGALRQAWSDLTFRGPATEGVTRNPFGYFDGIIVPRTAQEQERDVWIGHGPLAGGTIAVLRRFDLDVAGFAALDREEQDAVMGRRFADGAPLSGGGPLDQVNLLAKSAEGEFLTPARSHARAAHPSFTGSSLMLRRSYNYRTPDGTTGHVFVCFQNDVATFTRTMLRLEEVDALMDFATATAGGAFAVLPGFDADRPLGASLF